MSEQTSCERQSRGKWLRSRAMVIVATMGVLSALLVPAATASHSITEYPAGSLPQGMASGYDAIWVTDADPHNNVLRIDPATGVVTDTIALAGAERLANAIATGPDTGSLRGVWVAPEGDPSSRQETMYRIDPDTRTIVDTFALGTDNEPSRIAVGLGHVWFSVVAQDRIGRLDPRTGVVTEFDLGTPGALPIGITTARGRVWVAEVDPLGVADGAITSVCPSTGARVEYPVGLPGSGAGAFGLAVTGNTAWYTSGFSGESIGRLDLRRGTVTTFPTSVGGFPAEIVRAGNSLWYTDLASSEIGSIRSRGGTIHLTPTPTAGSGPFGIAAEGSSIWFAESAAARVGELQR